MDFDFSDTDTIGGNTVIATLPEDAHPWEYMIRFIEDSLNSEGWDGYPRLIVAQYTSGSGGEGGLGALTCLGVPLPPEPFRNDPMNFLGTFHEALVSNHMGLRERYGQLMGDTRICGIILANEGHGFRGERAETEAFYARAKAEGKRYSTYPEAVEVRVVLAIPLAEQKLYSLTRARGEEPEYVEVTKIPEIQETLNRSTSHRLSLGILLALVEAQAEAQGWPTL